jgi:hypothetical protein
MDNTIFINVSKEKYTELIGIEASDPNFYKIAFIEDGSGIITHGQLYINSPYWIKVVATEPEIKEPNTIYFLKEE